MKPRCNHCGTKGRRLRRSRTDPTNRLCPKCWERFGGSFTITNRHAARRRALGR